MLKRGLTLIELLVVMSNIGILAARLLPAIKLIRTYAKITMMDCPRPRWSRPRVLGSTGTSCERNT